METEADPPVDVVFFDLLRGLVVEGEERFVVDPNAQPWLDRGLRSGVLCNIDPKLKSRSAERILEEAGLYGLISPELIVLAGSELPVRLPDGRVFAVAAALAGVDPSRCGFVSTDQPSLAAAQAAGMQTLRRDAQGPTLLGDTGPILLAGEIDEDTGPTYVLQGRVVTMDKPGEVFEDAQIVVSRGRIAALLQAGDRLPNEFASSEIVQTDGTIYPGLIDLHNHFVYNVLPLWPILRQYTNRVDWPRAAAYKAEVSLPVRLLASSSSASRAVVRYVETKALVGGTTSGQGMRTRVHGGPRLFRGAMRNVEETNDPRLPEASTRVPNLFANAEGIAAFRRALETRTACFYHLAEGVDERARRTFADLADNELLRPSLAGIHCLGLEPEDLALLAQRGGKVVWSPYSNLLLYGETLDLAALAESEALFALGCDWSPTGSKNLLQELKVADYVVREQGAELTHEDLARSVTTNAAQVVGWQEQLGAIRVGMLADLLVLAGDSDDPYSQLISATEADIALVIVHGLARHGDREFVEQLHPRPDRPLEDITIAEKEKALYLHAADSDLNDVTFEDARTYLLEAMRDLPSFKQVAEAEGARLQSLGVQAQPFTIELDNEYEPTTDELQEIGAEATLLADWSLITQSIELDPIEVNASDYWERLQAQTNLPPGLKTELESAYSAN